MCDNDEQEMVPLVPDPGPNGVMDPRQPDQTPGERASLAAAASDFESLQVPGPSHE